LRQSKLHGKAMFRRLLAGNGSFSIALEEQDSKYSDLTIHCTNENSRERLFYCHGFLHM